MSGQAVQSSSLASALADQSFATSWMTADAFAQFGLALGKGLLTVAIVYLVIVISRRFNTRVAGAFAGLPTTTAPTLILLALSLPPDYAIRAAIGAMWASAAYAGFALVFSYACMRMRTAASTAISLAVCSLFAVGFMAWPFAARETLVATLLICVAIRVLLPTEPTKIVIGSASGGGHKHRLVTPFAVAICAGIASSVIAFTSEWLPAQYAGMLAAAPVIGATLAASANYNDGPSVARRLMAGYIDGCISKIVFCFVFAILLRKYGVVITVLSASWICLGAAGVLLWVATWTQRRAQPVVSHVAALPPEIRHRTLFLDATQTIPVELPR
ncbi:MAG: hypothetical protein ACRDAM_07460 [Casimicrobium sp.]